MHNAFLFHLPKAHHSALLALFNQSFRLAELPHKWEMALIIPIPKPQKDPGQLSSYRPISLLSCVGKLTERLLHDHLTWHLESKECFLPHQFGFRPGLSTIDALMPLEHEIQMALRSGQVLIAVYFDLKGAFDQADHSGILHKLAQSGIRGRMLRWLQAYLTGRSFRVSVAGSLSSAHLTRSGVPQGSILSPLLFNVLLQDLPALPNVETAGLRR